MKSFVVLINGKTVRFERICGKFVNDVICINNILVIFN